MTLINKIRRRVIYEIIKNKNKYQEVAIDKKYTRKDIAQIEINNYKLLVLPKTSIGKQLLIKKSFEKEDTEYLKKIIKNYWNIVDIGANVGYYTMLFAQYSSNGKVFAIEPVDYHKSMIELSCWLNSFNNVTIYPNIVSNKEEIVNFCISVDGAFSSIIDTERMKIERKVKVKTIILDKLISTLNIKIDLLKIDAEGAEKLILLGASDSLQNKKIKLIMVEMYDINFKIYNTSCDELNNILNSYGYYGYFMEKGEKINYSSKYSNRSLNVFYEIL
jgi:FkbM family methyltransferase